MKAKLSIAVLSATALLSACGGGGSSTSGSTPSTPTVPTPPVQPSTALQLTVPTPTYPAGSPALSAFNAINAARLAYGVGALAQNTQLDTAATNHANYMLDGFLSGNYTVVGHTEVATNQGFTGVTPDNRIQAAGYKPLIDGETVAYFISETGVASDPGVVSVNNWLSGPYHRFGVLDTYREIGLSDATTSAIANSGGLTNLFVADYGVSQSAGASQLPASTWIGVWPLNQAIGVNYGAAGESPNPITSANGACYGYPVSIQIANGLTLSTTSFTMIETVSGATVAVQLSTYTTDVNPSLARLNSAYIIPLKPLKLGTQYTVNFVGAGASAINMAWTFTTTPQNNQNVYGCNPS